MGVFLIGLHLFHEIVWFWWVNTMPFSFCTLLWLSYFPFQSMRMIFTKSAVILFVDSGTFFKQTLWIQGWFYDKNQRSRNILISSIVSVYYNEIWLHLRELVEMVLKLKVLPLCRCSGLPPEQYWLVFLALDTKKSKKKKGFKIALQSISQGQIYQYWKCHLERWAQDWCGAKCVHKRNVHTCFKMYFLLSLLLVSSHMYYNQLQMNNFFKSHDYKFITDEA